MKFVGDKCKAKDEKSMPDEFEMRGICADCSNNCAGCNESGSLCNDCRGGRNFKHKDIFFVEDTVKDPKAGYYDEGGIKALDVIKAKLTPDQYKGFLLGNLIKYACRANHKGQMVRDVEKIDFYSTELFNNMEP